MDLSQYAAVGQDIRRRIVEDSTITDLQLAEYVLNLCGMVEALATETQRELEAIRGKGSRRFCMKCQGAGQYKSYDTWGDCPACNGKGY